MFETKGSRLDPDLDFEEIYSATEQLRKEKPNFDQLKEATKRKRISERVSENREKDPLGIGTGKLGTKVNAEKVRAWAKDKFPAEDFQKLEDLIKLRKDIEKNQEKVKNIVISGKTEAQKDQEAEQKDVAKREQINKGIEKSSQESDSMGATPTEEQLNQEQTRQEQEQEREAAKEEAANKKAANKKAADDARRRS